MIQAFITVIAVLVLGIGVVIRGEVPTPTHVNSEVLAEVTNLTVEPEISAMSEEVVQTVASPSGTPTANPLLEIQNTPLVTVPDWIFPGSIVMSETPYLKTQSSVDPKAITDWYISQFKLAGMSTKTYIVSSTQEKTYNKLVASNQTLSIEVIVERQSSTEASQITVVQTSVN